ncbi:MAG: Fe-S cluster assembly protein SufD [Salaquimonas sp.]
MNIQTKLTHTAAEESLIAALAASERAEASDTMAKLEAKGLPTRRVEAWHYTDLRTLLRDFPKAPKAIDSEHAAEGLSEMADLVDGYTIGFSNTSHVQGFVNQMPEGVSGVVGDGPITPNAVPVADDYIGELNAALCEQGAVLNVDGGATIATPIILAHTCAGETASVLRHRVTAGEGSSVTIIERHHSSTIANHQNVVSNLTVAKGAKVVWVIDQELGMDTTRLGQLNVVLGEAADLTILVLNAGGKLVRQEIHIAINGENSNVAIKGVNLIGEGSHVDVTTTLAHNVPNTTATELFRNVVPAGGKGVFQGQIRVAQIAQKTDAQMACNTLLLSDESDFSAKPELEIFADDVICAHGATVTDIDDNHLFYLRARGISERDARGLLVRAFVEEVFEELDTIPMGEEIGTALIARIEDWLDLNG